MVWGDAFICKLAEARQNANGVAIYEEMPRNIVNHPTLKWFVENAARCQGTGLESPELKPLQLEMPSDEELGHLEPTQREQYVEQVKYVRTEGNPNKRMKVGLEIPPATGA